MKKLFDKDEIWFAVLWIVIYVVGFSNADILSEAVGMPKLVTTLFGLILSLVLWGFIRKHGLTEYFGLCPMGGSLKKHLFFLPLIFISSVNLWHGFARNVPAPEALFYILSMCCVGFVEEVIFRGFLFKGMCRSNAASAVVVSSLTFGMGHIVNLFLGEPLLGTLLQLVYASAIGFCYTAVFLSSGSIWPCIVSHAFVNSTSVFAAESVASGQVATAVIQSAVSIGYGIWLLRSARHQPET